MMDNEKTLRSEIRDFGNGDYRAVGILTYFLVSQLIAFIFNWPYLLQLAASIALVYFVYAGQRWARVLMAILFGLSSIAGLCFPLDLDGALNSEVIFGTNILLSFLSSLSAVALLSSKNVIEALELHHSTKAEDREGG